MRDCDNDPGDHPKDPQGRPERDERGRWLKGHCPNRKGRPKKRHLLNLDPTDLRWFANTLIEVRKEGKLVSMTRKAILYEKIFESATKDGKVSMQKFLYEKFEENDKRLAELSVWYQDLLYRWILNNPDWHKPGYELPDEVANNIAALRDLLNHYHDGMLESDDGDVLAK